VYHLCLALSLCHIILSSLCHWSAIHEHGSTVQWNINSQLSLNVLVLIDHNFHLHDHYCILVHYLELGECRTLWGKREQAAHTSITWGWFGKVAECEQDQIDRQTRVLLYSASTITRRWYCIAGLPTVVITNVCWDIFSHNRPQSCNSIYHYSYFPLIRLTDSQRMPKRILLSDIYTILCGLIWSLSALAGHSLAHLPSSTCQKVGIKWNTNALCMSMNQLVHVRLT